MTATTNTITLPGGVTLTLPIAPLTLPGVSSLPAIPNLPSIPGLDPSALLSQLAPALGQVASAAATASGNPLIAIGVSALGVLLNHLFDTQTQAAADPANQALQMLEQSLKARVQALFAPHVPAPAPTPAAA